MKKIFLLLALSAFITSCSTQKTASKPTKTNTQRSTTLRSRSKQKPLKEAQVKGYKMDYSNYPSIGKNDRVRFLVMHYTAGNLETSVKILTTRQVSAHYLIGDANDRNIKILVSEDDRAWHAGYSYWNGRKNLNDSSIGIEIVNLGFTSENGVKKFYPFPDYQIKKVARLMRNIVDRYHLEPTAIIGHSDIAPSRKYDPGPLFPWKKLHDNYNLGAWYNEMTKDYFITQFNYEKVNDPDFVLAVKKEFHKYGYQVNNTALWDAESRKLITTFQYHFRPANYSGYLDAETWAILKSLNQKYRTK